jgi:hypothetical protein
MIPKVQTCIEAIERSVEGRRHLEWQDAARGAAGTVHRARRRHADRAVTGYKAPLILAALAALLCSTAAAPAQQRACGSREPIDTLAELWPALYACWSPPAGTEGKELTLRFSIRRDGTLIGKPRATYSKLEGGGDLDRAFVASVLEALDRTLPLPITEGLGGVIAGRPMALRFAVPAGPEL